MKYNLALLVCLVSVVSWAQFDRVQVLDTIFLSDLQLKTFNSGQKQLKISDSVINAHNFALTDLLQQQAPIYFKQNGYGMVSSPAFRGTTAAQTAVVWNGININSTLTGQTDFNTLLTANMSSIDVKFGGGSVLYGTGAIGGSVHLHQNLAEQVDEQHQLQTAYGSFNTLETRYSYQNQLNNLKFKLGYARRQSDNDYDIPSQNRQNENGQFEMNSLDAVIHYDLSTQNRLKYFSNFTFGERNFSLIRASDPKTKYDNVDTRNMLEWEYKTKKLQSKLKLAYLTEEFTFFDNLSRDTSSSSNVETQWLQYEFWYKLKNIKLNAVINYQNAQAEGNQLQDAERDILGLSFLFQHQFTKQWNYEITVRQDVNDDFENPFLFSLGSVFQFNKKLSFRAHASKNYRLPGFNDLFWADGGNPDLIPETAYQAEIGSTYKNKNFDFSLTGFYNDIRDMIRWLPDNSGLWRPLNTEEVETYGIEARTTYSYDINPQSRLDFSTSYSYTISENQDTGNQLIYVPYHLANTQLSYRRKRWSASLFWRYNGQVFTRTDNNAEDVINDFQLVDLRLAWQFPKLLNSTLSIRAQNLFDTNYQVFENRPMPRRNFSIHLITTF
jgi:iron complex outermembrane receptor protein